MQIELHFFGQFQLDIDGAPVRAIKTGKIPLLFAYLCQEPGLTIPRQQVAFHLWPDSSEEQAQTNLRKILHQVRNQYPEIEEVLPNDARSLKLRIDNECVDVLKFEDSLQAAAAARKDNDLHAEQYQLERAVQAYSGEYLVEYGEEWILVERERLHQEAIRAYDRLITRLEERRHYRDAITSSEKLLSLDPLREESYRRLMRLHALNEDRAAALSVYHTCVTTLQRELGVEPELQTREIYERLVRDGSGAPKTPAPVPVPLFGREKEWKLLTEAWRTAKPGVPRLLLINGEPGIGKTRLSEDLLDWARRQGIKTGTAVCYDVEGQTSYTAVADWLRSFPLPAMEKVWLREIARVLPELLEERSDVQPPEPILEGWQRQVFFEALQRALFLRGEPLLLLMDNIQWCDRDTLDWLEYAFLASSDSKILITATMRTGTTVPGDFLYNVLMDIRQIGQLIEVELPRLDIQQTSQLTEYMLGFPPSPEGLKSLFTETEGVPLFVIEMCRAWLHYRISEHDVSSFRSPHGLPARIQGLLQWSLTRLSSPARALAQSAALIGKAFDVSLLSEVSEFDERATVTALDELWHRRIIREVRVNLYDFAHEKLRDAALEDISPVRKAYLHKLVALALERRQPETAEDLSAQIASQYEEGGMPQQAAVYYARAAAQAQTLFAIQDALYYLERSIQLDPYQAEAGERLEKCGDLYIALHEYGEAVKAYQRALERLAHDEERRTQIAEKLAELGK